MPATEVTFANKEHLLKSKSWSITNLVIVYPEATNFIQKKHLIDPNAEFGSIETLALNLFKNISLADEILGDWITK